jgi:CBS domain-containing protein
MQIETIMTKDPICCEPSDNVEKVASLMKEFDVGAIPVVSDFVSHRLVGIITDRDLCIAITAEGKDPRRTSIGPYFTRLLITCTPQDTLESCEELMKKYRVRRLPVVDRENTCVGMVSLADLARASTPERFQALMAEMSRPQQVRAVAVA